MKKRSCRCTFICLCLLLSCSCKASLNTTHTHSSCELHYVDKKIKSFIEYFYALKEPSGNVTSMTQELLRNNPLQESLVILETTRPSRSWNAFALGGISCTFMALPPVAENYQKLSTELFAFYHELGHMYYNHSTKRRIATLALLATSFLTYVTTSKIFAQSTLHQIVSLFATGFMVDSFINYTIEQEVEADLYACEQLKKEGKSSTVAEQIKIALSYISYIKNQTAYVPVTPAEKIMRLTHPDWQQRADYLQACLAQKH